VRCPDCHARVRGDAHVCYRCGYRPAVGGRRSADARGAASRSRDHSATLATTARRRGAASGSARLVWRLLALRLYAACPDCRRPMHADARVCAHCGYRLIR
jgi:RNA polymerase subunit RPABC4/transcription elongation factor Spt4